MARKFLLEDWEGSGGKADLAYPAGGGTKRGDCAQHHAVITFTARASQNFRKTLPPSKPPASPIGKLYGNGIGCRSFRSAATDAGAGVGRRPVMLGELP